VNEKLKNNSASMKSEAISLIDRKTEIMATNFLQIDDKQKIIVSLI
jgi:hypothetical protein